MKEVLLNKNNKIPDLTNKNFLFILIFSFFVFLIIGYFLLNKESQKLGSDTQELIPFNSSETELYSTSITGNFILEPCKTDEDCQKTWGYCVVCSPAGYCEDEKDGTSCLVNGKFGECKNGACPDCGNNPCKDYCQICVDEGNGPTCKNKGDGTRCQIDGYMGICKDGECPDCEKTCDKYCEQCVGTGENSHCEPNDGPTCLTDGGWGKCKGGACPECDNCNNQCSICVDRGKGPLCENTGGSCIINGEIGSCYLGLCFPRLFPSTPLF